MSSSLVPFKTRRVRVRYTVNLPRAEAFSYWCGVRVGRWNAISGVILVTLPWFNITRSVTKSPRVAE
ncbi:hypothetical protein TNCV_1118131 [Trichonephila clavipes]|nr:hypothetical protein TNCV_1118131 [Trichonephila clavipes]